MCFDETNAPKAGLIKRHTCVPELSKYEMIYSGPHFYVANPIYKTPRETCILNSDYDNVELGKIPDNYIQRTNYIPNIPLPEYNQQVRGFISNKVQGEVSYDNYFDYYKLGIRAMISQAGERSLICAVLPRRTAHIHGIISISYLNRYDAVDMAALCASIVIDFYIKTIAAQNLRYSRLATFPIGVPVKYKSALYSRTLLLNCLTNNYSEFWSSCWNDEYNYEHWSINDTRLKPFGYLTQAWSWNTPLRNHFERRQALVEIDVLAAMALGLSLKDLELIYTIQFPVLQQNENDTWYDQKGNIVFTCSKGLTGVGCDRKEWNTIRGEQVDENTFVGVESTYVHIIDSKKSELYGGEQVTYYAPYTRCDRIADYRRAWAYFEERFKNKD